MRILWIPLTLLLLLLPAVVVAEGGWRDATGKPIAETSTVKSRDGFNAMLLVTPDANWQEKWDTPPDVVPHFNEATEVEAGGELFILTFLSNPLLDQTGSADVTCDFLVLRPDGSASINERDMSCFQTELTSDPKNVYLSAASLKYVSEPGDLRGPWTVVIVLRDNVRGAEISLNTSFLVK